jgi:hypothetical protein
MRVKTMMTSFAVLNVLLRRERIYDFLLTFFFSLPISRSTSRSSLALSLL